MGCRALEAVEGKRNAELYLYYWHGRPRTVTSVGPARAAVTGEGVRGTRTPSRPVPGLPELASCGGRARTPRR